MILNGRKGGRGEFSLLNFRRALGFVCMEVGTEDFDVWVFSI